MYVGMYVTHTFHRVYVYIYIYIKHKHIHTYIQTGLTLKILHFIHTMYSCVPHDTYNKQPSILH